jgi:hypothetical protein
MSRGGTHHENHKMFDDVVVSYRSPVSLAGSSGSKASDAIESYRVGGVEYLVMANEGDTRDYTGFSEEVRIGAGGYVLDPAVFPDAATLKQQANLGRLTAPTRSAPKKAIPILSSRKSTCPARGLFRSVRQRAISSSTAATPLKRSLQRGLRRSSIPMERPLRSIPAATTKVLSRKPS